MNRFWIYLIAIALLTACKSEVKTGQKEQAIELTKAKIIINSTKQAIDTVLLSKTDTVFIVKNKPVKDDIGDKQKEYVIHVFFENKNWPELTYKNAIGADLALLGDLDGDKQPELLLSAQWFSSCWASVNLFSLKNNNWKLVKSGSMYFCSDQYPLAKRVVKTDKGYGLLTDSLANDKFITLKKEIKF